jgi:CRISPR-associated protein Csc2
MEYLEKIFEKGLIARSIDEIDLGKNKGIFVKIGIVSETKGFLIIRNNDPTETTSEEFFGQERVVIPGSKWRGAERTYALSLLRKFNGLVPQEYERNAIEKKELLIRNPLSALYGDSSIGSGIEASSIASRIYYDWSYSFEPLGLITERFTHNTLSESGTILMEEEGKTARNAIYNTQYIKPGVKFVRFVTLENVSKELLDLAILTIMGTRRYGARTAIVGENIYNNIVGIGFSRGDKPVTSYTLLSNAWSNNNYDPEKQIAQNMTDIYGDYLLSGNELKIYLSEVTKLKDDKDKLTQYANAIVKKMQKDWKDRFEKKKKRKGEEENEDTEDQADSDLSN